MTTYSFTVPGIPVSQGSKRHVGRGIMVESSKELRPWRDSVRYYALQARGPNPLLVGPVTVNILFVLPRPKAHFGTGKNAARVKPSAPVVHTGRGDSDKLARAILDALTGSLIRDDGQVWRLLARKIYGLQPRAEIIVDLWPGASDPPVKVGS